MGQRHQLFAVAKVNGKYRSLAAVHHQWLYGLTALERCSDILKIIKNTANTTIILAELELAATREETSWERADDDASEIPFPFVTTCLIVGAGFSAEKGYSHGVLPEKWNMPYNCGDNNNGITIVDVTTPVKPRYCFVDYRGMESTREVELMAPLPAETYFRAYYTEEDQPSGASQVLQELASEPLIEASALNEIWPDELWHNCNDITSALSCGEEAAAAASMSSLQLASMKTGIREILSENDSSVDVAALLQPFEHVAELRPHILSTLQHSPALFETSMTAMQLLQYALRGVSSLDLSMFKGMTVDQMSSLLSTCETTLTWLNLANMRSIDDSALARIASAAPLLRTIILYGTKTTYAAAVAAFADSKLQQLYHREPYSFFFSFGGGYGQAGPRYTRSGHLPKLHARNSHVSQIIYRTQDADRNVQHCAGIPLDELDVSPQGFMIGARSFGAFLSHRGTYIRQTDAVGQLGLPVAYSFALSNVSDLQTGPSHGIAPLQRQIFSCFHAFSQMTKPRMLHDGETALLIDRVQHIDPSVKVGNAEGWNSIKARGEHGIITVRAAFIACRRSNDSALTNGKNESGKDRLAGNAQIMNVREWVQHTGHAVDEKLIEAFEQRIPSVSKDEVAKMIEEMGNSAIDDFKFKCY